MAYFGKLVGIGLNGDGNPFGIYVLAIPEGCGDKWRLDTYPGKADSDVIRTIRAIPFGEAPQRNKENVEYDAIIADCKGNALVSGGTQAGMTWEKMEGGLSFDHSLTYGFINNGGAEPDSDRTPRVSAAVNVFSSGALGIARGDGILVRKINLDVAGKAEYVSSYTGGVPENDKFVISGLEAPTGIVDMYGRNAQEIADNAYDFIGGKEAVSSAAVLWTPGKEHSEWELAVRNRHK